MAEAVKLVARGRAVRALAMGTLVALLAVPGDGGAELDTSGRGLRIGDTGPTIGGYASLDLTRDEGRAARLALEDLSVFVIWDPLPRVHLFSELEIEEPIAVDTHGHGGTHDAEFTTERLYGDLTIADWLQVRGGKFLTPVGRWNVIHAQPLVWTTSRPLVTELPFDPHTTGAMLFGTLFPRTGALTYSLYGQPADQFHRLRTPQRAARSGGARVEYARDGTWSVGASYLAFTAPERDGWHHLTGLDGLWQHGPVELMGELAFVEVTDGANQWGLYVQAVEQILSTVYLVQRYEHADRATPGPEVDLFVLGVAYKPRPNVIVKGEYLFADHPAEESPPGVKTSVAVLF